MIARIIYLFNDAPNTFSAVRPTSEISCKKKWFAERGLISDRLHIGRALIPLRQITVDKMC